MITFVLVWLALSAVATLAFMFGSGLGYRRGAQEALAPARNDRARGSGEPEVAVELRLPEDAHQAT